MEKTTIKYFKSNRRWNSELNTTFILIESEISIDGPYQVFINKSYKNFVQVFVSIARFRYVVYVLSFM